MSNSIKKRTIDAFFAPPPKKVKNSQASNTSKMSLEATEIEKEQQQEHDQKLFSYHHRYPFPIAQLPKSIATELPSLPSTIGKPINDQPDLDLLYFQPFIPKYMEKELYQFLRKELPFYRVEYDIKRGGISAHIRTPRYTTVFGLDSTSNFSPSGHPIDSKTSEVLTKESNYAPIPPRPIPACLDALRLATEAATGCTFNFCLVNYYANGNDSISYHSDDEHFLGTEPAIASFSLGAKRDFLMKHKPPPNKNAPNTPSDLHETRPLKLPLGSGDMVLMRGKTQANWLHSIPKRTGKNDAAGMGRINVTFRNAIIKGGTENYYRYNVGTGPVWRWDNERLEMRLWKKHENSSGRSNQDNNIEPVRS